MRKGHPKTWFKPPVANVPLLTIPNGYPLTFSFCFCFFLFCSHSKYLKTDSDSFAFISFVMRHRKKLFWYLIVPLSIYCIVFKWLNHIHTTVFTYDILKNHHFEKRLFFNVPLFLLFFLFSYIVLDASFSNLNCTDLPHLNFLALDMYFNKNVKINTI